MAENSPTPSERIAAAFVKLSSSAKNINQVSDDLAKPVSQLEHALERLNLGVACWTNFAQGSNGYEFWKRSIGYARVHGKWCIAIQTSEGQEHSPEDADVEEWPFGEAPRYLRGPAVDKLPDLVEALVEVADATAKRLAQKIVPAQEMAGAVNAFLSSRKK